MPPEVFRAALGRFATGVTVVTTRQGDELHGMTANAFSSVSLDPPLVLVCVARGALLHELVPAAEVFGVSVLSRDQRPLSDWFALPDRPRGRRQFADVAHRIGPVTGVPLLEGAVARLECTLAGRAEAGDHTVFFGEVRGVDVDVAAPPLLYLDGGYAALDGAAGV